MDGAADSEDPRVLAPLPVLAWTKLSPDEMLRKLRPERLGDRHWVTQ